MSWRQSIAKILVPEEFAALEKRERDLNYEVGSRVADIMLKMDPFEPLIRKYNVVFPIKNSDPKPEEDLDHMAAIQLFMWAFGTVKDPNFLHLTTWLRNKQGNATIRNSQQDEQWFFGRASIATITLFIDEVGRLASRYQEIMTGRDESFDENLPIGEF